jgi:hypothetical protein
MADTQTEDRAAALHAQLAAAVESLTTGEDWAAMLATAARFHDYSLNNLFLIAAQMPTASRVAGYKTWQSLGRQVRKGERGIAIFAPMGGPCRACNGTGHHPTDKSLTCGRCFGAGRWQSFRVVYVFDVSQTDGDELPATIAPRLLAGDAPDGLWDGLADQVAAAGYVIYRYRPTSGANGFTDPIGKRVVIRDDVDDAQAAKTLAHELAHIALGHVADLGEYGRCRGVCEVEAESVAYIVAAASGMATDGYSLPYVASWAAGDAGKVRETASRVVATARQILAGLEAAASPVAEVAAA